ncbi:hypothetical protein DS830_02965 [Bombilactobacillus bombi]|uniref:hypothetical protein n=1 Tax=Bombilactobacillus bombi TaxID=1303590 RepID=UPI000E57937C|nr:hypothetical protein [Bombilactobacillus bombi]AXX64487.1 hypothetical protein DS830_02965 [Bombilactobacillus bombi]
MLLSYISTQELKQIRNIVWKYAKPKTYRRLLIFWGIVFALLYFHTIFSMGFSKLLHQQRTFWIIYNIVFVVTVILSGFTLKKDFKKGFLRHTKSGYYAAWISLSPDSDKKALFVDIMKKNSELLSLYNQNKGELHLSSKPGDNNYNINKDPIFKNLQSNPFLIHPSFKRYESFLNTDHYYIFVICVPHTKKQMYNKYQYLIFEKSKWNQLALNPHLAEIKHITDNYRNLANK